MTLTRFARSLCAVPFLMAAAACAPAEPPDTRAQDAEAVRKADTAFSGAAATKNVDAIVSYYTDDAIILPPNAAMGTGRDAIRKEFESMMALPGFGIAWQPTKVEVARSGDVGYSIGTYDMTMSGVDGRPMKDRGKYVTIWKKQADGSWKVALDMFNSDTPLPPPSK